MKQFLFFKYMLFFVFLWLLVSVFNNSNTVNISYKIPKKDRIDLAMKQEKLMVSNPQSNAVDRSGLIRAHQSISSKKRSMPNLTWEERGPNNVAGRVRAILLDQGDPNHKRVFAAGVSGGLWISNNIDAVDPEWSQVDDFLGNLSICAIAQDPNDASILYFGTGEGYFEEKATPGAGIWKSVNGGTQWSHLTTTANYQYINDLKVLNNGHLIAMTEQGIIKSTNHGASWSMVLNTQNGTSSDHANDLQLAADGTLYASFGIFSQGEIFKSTDQGVTWQKISAAITTSTSTRIELGMSPSNSNILYTLIADDSGICQGIYRSVNAGLSWSQINMPTALGMTNFARTQAWYNLAIAVSPTNPDHLMIGGIDLFLSINGGTSWKQISHWSGLGGNDQVHADQHALIFSPVQQGKVMVANDGGIYTCNDIYAQKPMFTAKNNGFNITQFYAVAAHPVAGTDYFLAGAQDNGTQKFDQKGINTTAEIAGGDGAYCYIDSDQPNIQIASYVSNNYFVSIDGGNNFTSISLNNDGFFANPSYYDHVRNILYASTKEGKILRWKNPHNKSNSYQELSIMGMSGQRITKIVASTTQTDKLFIGTDDGDVYIINQANQLNQFAGIKIREASNLYVSDIAVDPLDDEHLVITYSNYGVKHIYETYNNGITWNSLDGNLPDIPVRTLLFYPNDTQKLIIGTDLGVWMTDQINGSGTIWNQEITGLANVRVDMLSIRGADNLLIAATHGRGLFTSKSLQSLSGIITDNAKVVVEKSLQYLNGSCATGYEDVAINVNISGSVSTNATLNLVKIGGSASQGKDYQIITPSLSIVPGQTAAAFIIRIFDDAIKENIEDIRLRAQSSTIDFGSSDEISITIEDNDFDPLAGPQGLITLGTGTSAIDKYPLSAYYEDQKTQVLIRASELQTQGLQAGAITSIYFDVIEKKSDIPFTSFTIKSVQHTVNSFGLANDPFYNTTNTHYSGDYSTHTGWNEITLSTPILWDGTSNIILEFCYNNNSWSDSDVLSSTDIGYSAVKHRRVDAAVGCNLSHSNAISSLRPNLKLSTSNSISLSDQLATVSTNLDPYASLHVYDDQNKLLLSLKNLSSTAVSCMDISIDHYGQDLAAALWIGANTHVALKQFYIDCDQNFPYEITLYYNEDELNGFVESTDQLYMVKTDVPVQQMTAADNFQSVSPSNISRQNTAGGITAFTASFSSFSGFTLYENRLGTVPVEIFDFDGLTYPSHNELIWITAHEHQIDQYLIERSHDRDNFIAIGTVSSQNKIGEYVYRFIDEEMTINTSKYYYRLLIKNLDGTSTYSEIISLQRKDTKSKTISIAPNPYKQSTTISLPYEPSTYLLLHIIDIHGRIVRDLLQAPSSSFDITVEGLDAGTYFLQYIDQEGSTGSRQLISIN